MIQVTLKDIQDNNIIFRELSEIKMPILAAYKISKLIQELEKENQLFKESREELIKRYATTSYVNGESIISIPKENVIEYEQQIKNLLDTEVKIPLEKLNMEDLIGIELTPKQVISLDKFIK